jgi:hypothetical protein
VQAYSQAANQNAVFASQPTNRITATINKAQFFQNGHQQKDINGDISVKNEIDSDL